MADFSLTDLLATAGTNTGNFARDAANEVADGYCSLYRDYPRFFVGASIDPLSAFRRGLADSLCSGREPGLPNPPAPPFAGGQCECVYYGITFTVETYEAGNFIESLQGTVFVFGKIGSTRVVDNGNGTGSLQVLCQGQLACGENEWLNLVTAATLLPPYNYVLSQFNVFRNDNNPDTCGDPSPDFPLVSPPPGSLNPTISLPPASGAPNVNFPVLFAPITNNLNVNVPVDLDVGLEFNFDFGGVTFGDESSGNGEGSFTPADRGTLGDAASNAGNAANNANAAKDAANAAKDAADAAKDAAEAAKQSADSAKRNTDPPPPPGSSEVDENNRPPGDNDREGIENLVYVKINLTRLPKANKSMYGEGSPDVHYAGWFEFKAGGFPLPRQVVNFQESLFAAPKGVDGYAYCLTSSAEGYATEITRKIEV